MAKHPTVESLYSEGRSFPHGRVREPSHRVAHNPPMESAADKAAAHNVHDNQAPEDRHASNYDNDASGWVRGARGDPTGYNETAEGKPFFDRGNAWRQASKSIPIAAGDPAVIRKPVGEKP